VSTVAGCETKEAEGDDRTELIERVDQIIEEFSLHL